MFKPAFTIKLLLSISILIITKASLSQDSINVNQIDSVVEAIESTIKNKSSIKKIGLRKMNDDPTFLYDYYLIDTSEKKLLKVITTETYESEVPSHKKRNDTTTYFYARQDTMLCNYYFLNDQLIKTLQVVSEYTYYEMYFKDDAFVSGELTAHNKKYKLVGGPTLNFQDKARKFVKNFKSFPTNF